MAGEVWLATALREASFVTRCHTMPHHGSYPNGLHCHNMLNLLLILWPGDPPMNLIRAIQFHDVPERWTGDMPAPVKRNMKGLAELESHVFSVLGIGYSLSEFEQQWLKALDKVELLLWCKDQAAMGNTLVTQMIMKLAVWFGEKEKLDEIPEPVLQFTTEHVWSRLDDNLPTLPS